MPEISPNKPYRIGRSKTGLGLFATKPIKKGTKIIRYFGPLLDSRKKEDEEVDNKYLFEINSRWTIDGSPRSNVARYFNHSCNPNSETYDVGHRVFVRTLRAIKPGEEIVYDYGIDYLKNVIGRSNCKCSRCRRRRARKAREARALKKRRAARRAAKRRRK